MSDELIFQSPEATDVSFETPVITPIEFLTDIQGQSLYKSWLELGFEGSVSDFLVWLRGKSSYQSYCDTTTDNPLLTEKEWSNSTDNVVTSFANRVKLDNGFFESSCFNSPLLNHVDELKLALYPSGYKLAKIYTIVGGDIAFERASIATRINENGIIETVGASVPRVDYRYGKAQLLIEPTSTNHVINSGFSQPTPTSLPNNWMGFNPSRLLTSTDMQKRLPNGQIGGVLHGTQYGNSGGIRQNYTGLQANSFYTFSIYLRRPTLTEFNAFTAQYGIYRESANKYTPNSYVLISNASIIAKGMIPTSDWERYSMVIPTDSVGASSVLIQCDGNNSYLSVFCMWGAQLEKGTCETSYIPTTTTFVSRLADVAVIPIPTGVVEINENVNGVSNIITDIPSQMTISTGRINKIEMK